MPRLLPEIVEQSTPWYYAGIVTAWATIALAVAVSVAWDWIESIL